MLCTLSKNRQEFSDVSDASWMQTCVQLPSRTMVHVIRLTGLAYYWISGKKRREEIVHLPVDLEIATEN